MKVPFFLFFSLVIFISTPLQADLFTIELPNGEILISSQMIPGGKVIMPTPKGKSGLSSGQKSYHQDGSRKKSTSSRKPENIGPRELPDRALRFKDFVENAAKYYDLPPALLWAVMSVESNFYPNVVSNKGAQGLMQLLPGTAADMGVKDSFDPEQNIYGGARFLRILVNRFNGDLVLTLSAYFAGGQGMQNAHDRNRSDIDGEMFSKQVFEYVRKTISAYYAYRPDGLNQKELK